MSAIGHFPMTENPQHFLKYLHPVLSAIATGAKTVARYVPPTTTSTMRANL